MEAGLEILGQTIAVSTDDSGLWSYLLDLKKIHVFKVRTIASDLLPSGTPAFAHRAGDPARIEYDPISRTVKLIANWGRISASGTIENLLGQLAGLACFDAGLVPVHGAAISIAGEMYLIIGGSGAGKSSLCLAMMARHGVRWEANDYFCLGRGSDGGVYVQVVDDYFDFRVSVLDELRDAMPPAVLRELNTGQLSESWTKSPSMPLNMLRETEEAEPTPIKGIIFPAITTESGAAVGPIAAKSAAASLVREVAWSIRGVGSFVLGNDGAVLAASPSISPTDGWQSACELLTELVSDTPAWAAVGSIRSLADALHSTVMAR
jgi:hypothetical protein